RYRSAWHYTECSVPTLLVRRRTARLPLRLRIQRPRLAMERSRQAMALVASSSRPALPPRPRLSLGWLPGTSLGSCPAEYSDYHPAPAASPRFLRAGVSVVGLRPAAPTRKTSATASGE